MKNAAIVLLREDGDSGENDAASECLDAFRAYGYVFSEIRGIYASDSKRAENAVDEMKTFADNVVLVADKSLLSLLSKNLSTTLQIPFLQNSSFGSGTFSKDSFTVFLLPSDKTGAEIAKSVCIPYLNGKYETRYEKTRIRFVGGTREETGKLLNEARRISGDALKLRFSEKNGDSEIEMIYDAKTPKMLTDDVLRFFAETLDDKIYTLDGTPLEVQLVRLLKLRGKKIAVAESFTGGGIAKRIVSVPGASEVYFEGLNTYSEKAKQIRLGVSAYTLNTFGAVSDTTAYEMAAGLLTGDADVVVATTGLAGPKSDRSDLPVGLCYLAAGTKEKIFVYRYKFDGNRENITEKAITYALFNAYKLLKNGAY